MEDGKRFVCIIKIKKEKVCIKRWNGRDMAGRTCQPCKEVRASIETRFPSKKVDSSKYSVGSGFDKEKDENKI